MPAVSVILPTCDRPHLWPRALASVLRQTHEDFEVLLVDSNRRLPALRLHPAIGAALTHPRVRILVEEHAPNSAAARNVGLRAARGDWITYLDDDDVYQPGKIAAQFAAARQAEALMVLCGYTVVLPRRCRTRQVGTTEYCGDALLTDATWCTSLLFHRRDPDLMFDESLDAGEDEVFAHAFLAAHGIARVPNCSRSLLEMRPDLRGPRVHDKTEALWVACRANWRESRQRYSSPAWRAYLAKGRLVRAQGGHGNAGHFARCAWAVWMTRGPGAWRLILNATARRLKLFRNWVVS